MTTYVFKQRNENHVAHSQISIDDNGEHYGKFDVSFRDPFSASHKFAWNKALNALSEADLKRATDPQSIEDQKFSIAFDTRFFVENYVKGSDIPVGEAKWKHDKEDLIGYMTLEGNGFILPQLQAFSNNAANFRKQKEDDAKNA